MLLGTKMYINISILSIESLCLWHLGAILPVLLDYRDGVGMYLIRVLCMMRRMYPQIRHQQDSTLLSGGFIITMDMRVAHQQCKI
jgi:hypothetical protein